jgi:hypothetical protein
LLAIADDLTLSRRDRGRYFAPLLDAAPVPEGATRLALVTRALATRARRSSRRARPSRTPATSARKSTTRDCPGHGACSHSSTRHCGGSSRLDGALSAPDLLGWSQPRTYLILAQNDDELRPTGGFITAIGVCASTTARYRDALRAVVRGDTSRTIPTGARRAVSHDGPRFVGVARQQLVARFP